MAEWEIGKPLRGEAADRIMERIAARVQPRPQRCPARLGEWRCHRDAGHADAHVNYAEHGDGLVGWRNEESRPTLSGSPAEDER